MKCHKGGGVVNSVGEEYQAVKRRREYHGCGEEYKEGKMERESNIIFPTILRLFGRISSVGRGEGDGKFWGRKSRL